MPKLTDLKKEMTLLSSSKKKEVYQRFFKTGKGQYGEGDVFIGITVPEQRILAKKYKNLSFSDKQKLLESKIHEERLVAILMLVELYKTENKSTQKKIFDFYIKNAMRVNNWDLVDLSADKIVGQHLLDKNRKILYKLVKSKNLWERRISIVATLQFIKSDEFDDTLKLAELLLDDTHDLIHKSVGWMLREVGKRNQEAEELFLKKNYKNMPRTMLRYSIERFDDKKRKFYMKK